METIEATDTLKSINTTPHLCRSKVKQTALKLATIIRPANKSNRVGMSLVERLEAKVRAAIRRQITARGIEELKNRDARVVDFIRS